MNANLGTAPLGLALVMLLGCAQPPTKQLYMWGNFPRQQYATLLADGTSPNQQIQEMKVHAQQARAASGELPPGFRAHLGMLQLSTGNMDAARQLWQAEKVAFPESAPYMDSLIKRLNEPASSPSAKTGNPE